MLRTPPDRRFRLHMPRRKNPRLLRYLSAIQVSSKCETAAVRAQFGDETPPRARPEGEERYRKRHGSGASRYVNVSGCIQCNGLRYVVALRAKVCQIKQAGSARVNLGNKRMGTGDGKTLPRAAMLAGYGVIAARRLGETFLKCLCSNRQLWRSRPTCHIDISGGVYRARGNGGLRLKYRLVIQWSGEYGNSRSECPQQTCQRYNHPWPCVHLTRGRVCMPHAPSRRRD